MASIAALVIVVVRENSSKIQCRQENSGGGSAGQGWLEAWAGSSPQMPRAIWHDPQAKVIALTSPAGSHARADRLRIAPFTSDEALSPWRERVISQPGQTRSEAWMAACSARLEQRAGQVRPPSQSFVHALSGAHHGNRCMNGHVVRKTVGCDRGARISAMPAKVP